MSSVLARKEVDGHIIRTISLHRVDNRKVADITLHLVMLVHIRSNIKMSTSGNGQWSLSDIETIEVCLVKFRGYRCINILAQKGIKTDGSVKERIP